MSNILSYFMRKDNVLYIACFMIFLLAFGMRLHFIAEKSGMHEDENVSIILCTYKHLSEEIVDGELLSGKEIKKIVYFSSDSIGDAFSDVKKLYSENNDRPHTNLYYSSLRLWFAGIAVSDFKKIIEHGCRLNLLFFLFSFFFLYKLLRRLFNDEKMIILGVFVAFINTGTISNTLFLRPYQQQETFLIIFTYLCLNMYEDIKSNKFLLSYFCYIKIFLIVALTLLTGYFVALYVLMFFCLLGVFAEKNKIESAYKKMSVLLFGSIMTASLLFPGYLKGFTSGRAAGGFRTFGITCFFSNLIESVKVYFCDIFLIHLIPPVIFIFLVVLIIYNRDYFYKNKFQKSLPLIISFICIAWSLGITFLAPFKVLRYSMSCIPLLLLIIPFIFDGLKAGIKKIALLFIMLFYFLYVSFYGQNVMEFMFKEQIKHIEEFKEEMHLKTILLITTGWQYAFFVHLLDDERKYSICYSMRGLKEQLAICDELVVISLDLFSHTLSTSVLEECLQENFDIKKSACIKDKNFIKYIIKRKNNGNCLLKKI